MKQPPLLEILLLQPLQPRQTPVQRQMPPSSTAVLLAALAQMPLAASRISAVTFDQTGTAKM